MSQLGRLHCFCLPSGGEIQHFSDLKVISLTLLNKLVVLRRPPPLPSHVFIHPSTHPSLLPAQLGGIQLFHSENESLLPMATENKLLLFAFYERKKK